jgi:hypothetical protein
MELQILNRDFTICKIGNLEQVDFAGEYIFLAKTDDEVSLVCESAYAPANAIASEPGWKGLKITGILDFGMVGVIAKIAEILADAAISIFVASTYNTDYIFVKAESFDTSVKALALNGYIICGE